MKENIIKRVLSCLIVIVLLGNYMVLSQTTTNAPNSFRSKFRYAIVSNNLEGGSRKVSRRFLEVLIDKSAFNEDNLILLFDLLAKRYPKPHTCFTTVYTSLNDIETPEERDRPLFSEIAGDVDVPNMQDSAILTRTRSARTILIYYENGKSVDLELD